MNEYRVDPKSPTRVAMKIYQGPEPDNRWVDLVRGRYTTWDEVKDWIPLVPVHGPDADTIAQVRTWHEPLFSGGTDHEVEVIRRWSAQEDAQIAADALEHAYPTNTPHEGVSSDQGRTGLSKNTTENRGTWGHSPECASGDHNRCTDDIRFRNECDCKCHRIRAAYSG